MTAQFPRPYAENGTIEATKYECRSGASTPCGVATEGWSPVRSKSTSPRVCSIEGCDKRAIARGWCEMHYRRWKAHGSLDYVPYSGRRKPAPRVVSRELRLCSIEGCGKPHESRGFCGMHYRRFRLYGDPLVRLRETRPVADRLWERVDKTGDCWVWTGYRMRTGYGMIGVGSKTDGTKKHAYTHRVAWEVTYGPIPPGMVVCHRCDNPPCCRPDHLFLGTAEENRRDMYRKLRHSHGDTHSSRTHPERIVRGDAHPARRDPSYLRRGSAHGSAKLTEDKVREIRRLFASGQHTQTELAAQFGVSFGSIHLIVQHKTWRHVDG